MAREVVKLATEMDYTQPIRGAGEMEKAHREATSKMSKQADGTSQSVLKIGETTSKVAGIATAGFSAVAAGITAAKASTDNWESSVVSIGSSLTAAFIAGGPIGLGVGLLGVGIGLLAGKTDESAEAAKRAKAEHDAWLRTSQVQATKAAAKIDTITAAIRRSVFEIQGAGAGQFDILGIDLEIAQTLEKQRAAVDALVRAREAGRDVAQLERNTESLRQRLAELDDLRQRFRERSILETVVGGIRESQKLSEDAGRVGDLTRQIEALEGALVRIQIGGDEGIGGIGLGNIRAAIAVLKDALQAAKAEGAFDLLGPSLDQAEKLENIRARLTGQDSGELALQQEIGRLLERRAILEQAGGERNQDAMGDLDGLIRQRREELEVLRQVNDALAERDRLAGDQALTNEIQLLGEVNAKERERLLILQEEAALLKEGRDPALVAERTRLLLAQLDAQEAIDPFLQSLGNTLSAGLADFIVDGITNGFESAKDIALNIVNALLRQIIQNIVASGLSQIMGGALGGGGGGGGILSSLFGGLLGGGGGGGSAAPALDAGAVAAPC